MEYREFLSLTNSEIEEIVEEIIHPEKINSIELDQDRDCFICNFVMKWSFFDDDENVVKDCFYEEEIEFYYPYTMVIPIIAPFSIDYEDIVKYKRMCYKKGIVPEWMRE